MNSLPRRRAQQFWHIATLSFAGAIVGLAVAIDWQPGGGPVAWQRIDFVPLVLWAVLGGLGGALTERADRELQANRTIAAWLLRTAVVAVTFVIAKRDPSVFSRVIMFGLIPVFVWPLAAPAWLILFWTAVVAGTYQWLGFGG